MSRSQKLTLLTALYLAQGVPFGFLSLALPAMLREGGFSLKTISALSLLGLPWALKFLWAPYLDHRASPRTWLLLLQSASIAAALVLSQLNMEGQLVLLLVAAFVFSLLTATQDVVTDGLAVRMLDDRERGLANGIQVGAYRVGMILGGGALLWLFAKTNWTVMFLAMAALLAVTMIPVLWLRDTPARSHVATSNTRLLTAWLRRLSSPGMLGFIGLIFCYRYGDQLITSQFTPFLVDYGLTKEAIALMKGTVGSVTSLAGALLGGWLAYAIGRRTLLLSSGVAQVASFMLYILVALGDGGDIALLWTATILEGVINTMAQVALFTLMMDAADPEHAGTDFTLMASAMVLIGGVGTFTGGAIADAFGYPPAFVTGALLALAGCVFVVWSLDRQHAHAGRIAEVWHVAARSDSAAAQRSVGS